MKISECLKIKIIKKKDKYYNRFNIYLNKKYYEI